MCNTRVTNNSNNSENNCSVWKFTAVLNFPEKTFPIFFEKKIFWARDANNGSNFIKLRMSLNRSCWTKIFCKAFLNVLKNRLIMKILGEAVCLQGTTIVINY